MIELSEVIRELRTELNQAIAGGLTKICDSTWGRSSWS